jgi:hypothetical protein
MIGTLIVGDEILSGKRQDRHLAHVIATLASRALRLSWARYEGDDRARLTSVLRESFTRGDVVFCFGGVGATPDDHTRQAAAAALGVPLEGTPGPRRIGAQLAHKPIHRVLMAEFRGCDDHSESGNRVASFSIRGHHFGLPQMVADAHGCWTRRDPRWPCRRKASGQSWCTARERASCCR